jgi:hypothetical protein
MQTCVVQRIHFALRVKVLAAVLGTVNRAVAVIIRTLRYKDVWGFGGVTLSTVNISAK